MKLCEMNSEQLAKALVALAAPVESIAKDEAVGKALADMQAKSKEGESVPMIAMMGDMVGRLVPVLLGEHAGDLFTILAALTGKSAKEIKAQNGFLTIKEAKESFSTDLLDFFTSSAPLAAEK